MTGRFIGLKATVGQAAGRVRFAGSGGLCCFTDCHGIFVSAVPLSVVYENSGNEVFRLFNRSIVVIQ